MRAMALLMITTILVVPLAGCVDSGDGPQFELSAEDIEQLIDNNMEEFLNNTSITLNQNVNYYNNSSVQQPSVLKSISGTMVGNEYSILSAGSPALLIREDAFPAANASNSAAGLDGANICVGVGTTTEGNMQDWFSSREITFTSIGTADAAEATDKLIAGECDAFTGDMSAMVAKKWALDNDGSIAGGTWIASELLSKEPLGAATRDGDSDFKDVVAWVWYGMVTAEEMGVTAANAADMATSSCALLENDAVTNPGMCRLLTSSLGLGTTDNPVAGTWMQAVLAASGNYGEAYDDAFCDGSYDGTSGSAAMTGCLISRVGTANALVSEGGLQFAPPMR